MAKMVLYVVNVWNEKEEFEGTLRPDLRIELCDFRYFQYFTTKEAAKEFLKKSNKEMGWHDMHFKLRVNQIKLQID